MVQDDAARDARGQELLGHELAHVVQQSEGRVPTTTQFKGVDGNDDRGLEREADEWAARAVRGEPVGRSPGGVVGGSGPVQRQAIQREVADGGGGITGPGTSGTASTGPQSRVAELARRAGSAAGLRAILTADPSLAHAIPAYFAAGHDDPTLNALMTAAFPIGGPKGAEPGVQGGRRDQAGDAVTGKNPTDPTIPCPPIARETRTWPRAR